MLRVSEVGLVVERKIFFPGYRNVAKKKLSSLTDKRRWLPWSCLVNFCETSASNVLDFSSWLHSWVHQVSGYKIISL